MNTILVLNPNTSEAMTEDIAKSAEQAASPQTETIVTNPDIGPESLESYYEYHLAAIAMLETIADYRGEV
ncbi:aspartate/glutamate racemase family protein, partial [Haladaptatus sp. W1]